MRGGGGKNMNLKFNIQPCYLRDRTVQRRPNCGFRRTFPLRRGIRCRRHGSVLQPQDLDDLGPEGGAFDLLGAQADDPH